MQEAFKNWQDTQYSVTLLNSSVESHQALKRRNKTWDIYCARRDGKTDHYYHDRREKYDRPLISDAEIRQIEERRRKALGHD